MIRNILARAAAAAASIRRTDVAGDGRHLVTLESLEGRVLMSTAANGAAANPLFASGQGVVTPVGANGADPTSMLVQPNGKVVVAGHAFGGLDGSPTVPFLVRYNADGTLDAHFGTGGKVTAPGDVVRQQFVRKVVTGPGGKLIVLVADDARHFHVYRFTADGHPDTTFGDHGRIDFAPEKVTDVEDLAMGKDGGVTVLALKDLGPGQYVSASPPPPGFITSDIVMLPPEVTNALVLRFRNSGRADASFGTAGAAEVDVLGHDEMDHLLMQRDGRVVISGNGSPAMSSEQHQFEMARLTRRGKPDATFGKAAAVTEPVPGFAVIGQAADGKLIVAGQHTDYAPGQINPFLDLRRYDADGTLDATYGAHGTGSVFLGYASPFNLRSFLEPDGSVTIVSSDPAADALLTFRFAPDGRPDTAFAPGAVRAQPLVQQFQPEVFAVTRHAVYTAGRAGVPALVGVAAYAR